MNCERSFKRILIQRWLDARTMKDDVRRTQLETILIDRFKTGRAAVNRLRRQFGIVSLDSEATIPSNPGFRTGQDRGGVDEQSDQTCRPDGVPVVPAVPLSGSDGCQSADGGGDGAGRDATLNQGPDLPAPASAGPENPDGLEGDRGQEGQVYFGPKDGRKRGGRLTPGDRVLVQDIVGFPREAQVERIQRQDATGYYRKEIGSVSGLQLGRQRSLYLLTVKYLDDPTAALETYSAAYVLEGYRWFPGKPSTTVIGRGDLVQTRGDAWSPDPRSTWKVLKVWAKYHAGTTIAWSEMQGYTLGQLKANDARVDAREVKTGRMKTWSVDAISRVLVNGQVQPLKPGAFGDKGGQR